MAKPLYLVKIGGSVITDTTRITTSRKGEILRLVDEIIRAKEKGDFDLIIGNGGGSFGHIIAKQYNVQEGLLSSESYRGALMVHEAVSKLSSEIVDIALEKNFYLFPFAPSSFAYSRDRRIVEGDISPIRQAIEKGFIPIVYGDTMIDSQRGVTIISTEEVFRFISMQMKPEKIIIGTEVDGVFDKNPDENTDAKLVESINSANIHSVLSSTDGAKKIDVTGGMKSKLSILYEMVKSSNSTGYIANANTPGVMEKLLLSQKVACTTVNP